MGGVAKKAVSFTPVGMVGGALAGSGRDAASEWQAQYDALAPGARPDLEARKSRLGADGLLQDVYRLKGPEAWQKAALEQQALEQTAGGDLAARNICSGYGQDATGGEVSG